VASTKRTGGKGKKHRKHGRESARHMAHARYNNARRDLYHKAIRILRKMRQCPNYTVPANISNELRACIERLRG